MAKGKTYVLFEVKLVPETPPVVILTQQDLIAALMRQHEEKQQEEIEDVTGSQYKPKKKKKKGDKPKFKKTYEFIATVNSPEEVAELVRRDPHKKYLLFEGVTKPIDVQIPVLIGGIPSDNLSREWGNLGEFNPELLTDEELAIA